MSERPRDHLMTIRYFAHDEKDAWHVANKLRAIVGVEFDSWREIEVTTAGAFMSRQPGKAQLSGEAQLSKRGGA
jgi:hypothetical protein